MRVVAVGAPEGVHPDLRACKPSLEDLISVVADLPGDVLLVSRDDAGRSVARAARLAIGGNRLAHLHIPFRATQWALVLGALVRLPDSAAGGARAVAEALLLRMRTQLVLSSVTALNRPSPSLGQHVASYWPWTAFLVDVTGGKVTSFDRQLSVGPYGVVLARSSRQVVTEDLIRNLPAPGLEIRVPDTEWKARRWCEVTSLDTRVDDVVAGALHSEPWIRCGACDRAGLSGRCLFCEVDLPGTPPLAGSVPATPQGVVR